MTYAVRARRAGGFTTNSRLSGTRATDWFELAGLPDDTESEVIARLSLVSWQPYEVDAIPDCLRAARDVCNVLTVMHGNQLAFEPSSPPDVERLDAAKGSTPTSGGSGATVVGTQSIENDQYSSLNAASSVHETPELRADLDTWRLAMLESDAPTRIMHYFRIYEREAQAIVGEEPQLLSSDNREACLEALLGALPADLAEDDRERVRSAVQERLSRLRERSRPTILAERLSDQLGREVTRQEILGIDSMRGRYAHRSSELDSQPEPQEEQLLRDVAVAFLQRALS